MQQHTVEKSPNIKYQQTDNQNPQYTQLQGYNVNSQGHRLLISQVVYTYMIEKWFIQRVKLTQKENLTFSLVHLWFSSGYLCPCSWAERRI